MNTLINSAQLKNNLSEITDYTWSHVVTEPKEDAKIIITACRAIYPQVS